MRFRFRPDDEYIGERRIGDPHLGADQTVAALGLDRPGLHARRIGAGVRLGQPEAADPLAADKLRKVLPLLLFRAVGENRINDERRLHAHHRAIAGIDALHLACDEAVGDVGRADAAIGVGHGHTEQAEVAHLAEDRRVRRLLAVSFGHARLQLFLGIGARRVADHPLVFAQLILEEERIVPLELAFAGHLYLPSHCRVCVIASRIKAFKRN